MVWGGSVWVSAIGRGIDECGNPCGAADVNRSLNSAAPYTNHSPLHLVAAYYRRTSESKSSAAVAIPNPPTHPAISCREALVG